MTQWDFLQSLLISISKLAWNTCPALAFLYRSAKRGRLQFIVLPVYFCSMNYIDVLEQDCGNSTLGDCPGDEKRISLKNMKKSKAQYMILSHIFPRVNKGDYKIISVCLSVRSSVRPSVRPSQLCGHCTSETAGHIHPILSSMEPSWPVDVQRYGHWPRGRVWTGYARQCLSCQMLFGDMVP